MKKSKFRDWLLGKDTMRVNLDSWIKKKLAEIESGKSILDAGAGNLRWKTFCSHLKYTSQDFAQYDAKSCSIGLQSEDWTYPSIDIVSDITDIPVPDESFDFVLCTEVFEHLPNPNAALKELVRVTKRGGTFIDSSVLQSDPYGTVSFLHRL